MGAPMAPHSTRSLWLRLLAAAAIAAIALLLQRTVLDPAPDAAERSGSVVREASFDSELLGREMPVRVIVPPGARDGKRGLVVFLHGRGSEQPLDPELFDGLARQGGAAPVVAFPGGGGESYWHDRDSGEWGSYVLDELVPWLIRRFDIAPERVAIGGISMGGFGAFNLARQRPDAFCAVAGHSPAIWEEAGDTAPGAFDDAEDFARNDVLAALAADPPPLAGKRTWVDAGSEDPFAPAAAKLHGILDSAPGRAAHRSWPGDHESSYWRGNWRAYMRFYAEALKDCGREA